MRVRFNANKQRRRGAREHLNRAVRCGWRLGLRGVAGGMVSVESIVTRGAPRAREAQLLATPELFASAPPVQCSATGDCPSTNRVIH